VSQPNLDCLRLINLVFKSSNHCVGSGEFFGTGGKLYLFRPPFASLQVSYSSPFLLLSFGEKNQPFRGLNRPISFSSLSSTSAGGGR